MAVIGNKQFIYTFLQQNQIDGLWKFCKEKNFLYKIKTFKETVEIFFPVKERMIHLECTRKNNS
jgi:hypothetical protein